LANESTLNVNLSLDLKLAATRGAPMSAQRSELLILQSLLDAPSAGDGSPGIVSGTTLANALGMSRVAIWQHLEKLREQGFTIESLHARGYRLAARPATLHATLIDAYRHPGPDSPRIHVLDTVDSTNDEASRRLAAGQPAPFAVLARRQEKGRGRFGRVWQSATDGNLYSSFAFRPDVEPARMQTFTLWMGVNICALVASFCRTAPGIKWPNDLLFDGRKAGGMLTEARMDADRIHDLVFGLGLNLTPPPEGWPPELAMVATSLSEHTGRPVDANKFAAALVGRVLDAYAKFLDGSYQKTFARLWNGYDLLRGRAITLLQGTRSLSGTAVGIDDEGSLLVRLTNGHTDRFRAGEVTFSKK
jgi:BirA family biotin operon repressor/biotin-[acetyl-CoA-carboxylase] ligase